MLQIENKLRQFDIYPKIVPVGKPVEFTLRCMDPDLLTGSIVSLSLHAIEGAYESLKNPMIEKLDVTPLEAPMVGYRFTATLPDEQEYLIYIDFDDSGMKRLSGRTYLSVYALQDDLLQLKPLIGDFHAHTFFSDGKEGPAFVAAEYREQGYDFMAVTDHRRRNPSIRAIEAYQNLNLPFKLYPGEEVHPHDSYVHIVNFGSDLSANEFALAEKSQENWRNSDATPEYNEELEKIKATLTDLPEGVNPRETANAILVSEIIRKGGGMSILAHPHWLWRLNNVPDKMNEYFWSHNTFDALELIGGMMWQENQSQIALYNEWRAKGRQVPVVGSSDEHGVLPKSGGKLEYFTEERTVVFAKENTRDDIINAVKSLNSTVVLKYDGEYPQVAGGSYRLQLYTIFLLRNYFPLRDKLYAQEGELMHEYIAGTPDADKRLQRTVAENAYFENKYFKR